MTVKQLYLKLLGRQRTSIRGSRELLYLELLFQELSEAGVNNFTPKPFGAAANSSLLYVYVRLCKELQPNLVVELGAGETTRLGSALMDVSKIKNLVAYEQDEFWANRIQQFAPSANVIHSKLSDDDDQRYVNFTHNSFDLLIIDGPVKTQGRGRHGAIKYINETQKTDFTVVIDDIQRNSEWQLAKKIFDLLNQKHNAKIEIIEATKAQAIITVGSHTDIPRLGSLSTPNYPVRSIN